MLSRRQFVRVGLGSALVLGAARWLDRPRAEAAPARYRFLDERGAAAVAALVPVVVAGALPAGPEARARAVEQVTAAFDRAVSGLSEAVRSEVDELLALLRFAPARLMFTGLWSPLEESTEADIAEFLERWRFSRFDIQRAGYHALSQLLQAAWYGNADSWPAIGYPGPPPLPA